MLFSQRNDLGRRPPYVHRSTLRPATAINLSLSLSDSSFLLCLSLNSPIFFSRCIFCDMSWSRVPSSRAICSEVFTSARFRTVYQNWSARTSDRKNLVNGSAHLVLLRLLFRLECGANQCSYHSNDSNCRSKSNSPALRSWRTRDCTGRGAGTNWSKRRLGFCRHL